MRRFVGSRLVSSWRRGGARYLLAMAFATVLGLVVAVPVFAANEPAGGDGGTYHTQVVGGEPVPNGKYGFVAALRDVTRGSTAYQQQFCGGTLIDRDSVLTAAHCVEDETALQLRVTVGRTLLDSDQGQTRRVEGIYRHPMYTSSRISSRYDAAVLDLARNVRGIAPATIPGPNRNGPETPGRLATVAGWGNTIEQSPSYGQPDNYPRRMQEAQVPIVSDTRAKEVYGSDYAPALMLAAGREGKDTCQGDSGGPIFVKKSTGRVLDIGITSFGNGCGARGYPGVYTEANARSIRSFVYDAAGR